MRGDPTSAARTQNRSAYDGYVGQAVRPPRQGFLGRLCSREWATARRRLVHMRLVSCLWVRNVNCRCRGNMILRRSAELLAHLGRNPSKTCFTMAGTRVFRGVPLNFPSVEIETRPCSAAFNVKDKRVGSPATISPAS